jgi:DNA excision repair protein ERCC-2
VIEIKQRVSVRNLVEFVLRHGDLETGFTGGSRMVEGIRAHQFLQKSRGTDYQPEVTLRTTYRQEDVVLEIHGRADGVIKNESGVTIEEIKSTSVDLELIDESFSILHWAQAQCYAYFMAEQENLTDVGVQLTYIHLDTNETKTLTKMFRYEDLNEFFLGLVKRYLTWARRIHKWVELRNSSIRNLEFPYPWYRLGQRELVVAVYKTIKEGKRLFAQAPTGIGKTLGTIFPAVKCLAEGHSPPIFYLTAKTITRTVAENTLEMLRGQGLALKRLTITAKDKVCFCPECKCTPKECRYAKGYYDRVGAAVEEIFKGDNWDREHIERLAREFEVCPFEFSLDLSNWSDFIICDYNYVFDPRVYLKRFFLEGGEYTFLIDEAHNLVDRAREMFSAELKKEEIHQLIRDVKIKEPVLAKRLQTINNHLGKLRKKGLEVEKDAPISLYSSLEKFLKEAEAVFKKEESPSWREKLEELYFTVHGFLRTAESYNERYVTYYKDSEQEFIIKLFCVDPSQRLAEALDRSRASVFFSATLSPIEYYIEILGGEVSSYKLKLGSPFPADNLCLIVHNRISTKYTQRISTVGEVAKSIASVVQAKTGNYLVYFPSYEYLREVTQNFCNLCPEVQVISQTPGMTEEARENFLGAFELDPRETLVGFALMGGIFGEGVDLTGERLLGAVIVGVGLPQIGPEREIIRSHFEARHRLGFEFAYMYPGMNKVLQAVGRVIRTEKDRGVVLLIDERFSRASYRGLYPKEWNPVQYIGDTTQIPCILQKFWNP